MNEYRVYVLDYAPRFYPTTNLELAIILGKTLLNEKGAFAESQVKLYKRDDAHPDGWSEWFDKDGKSLKEIEIKSIGPDMVIQNLAQ